MCPVPLDSFPSVAVYKPLALTDTRPQPTGVPLDVSIRERSESWSRWRGNGKVVSKPTCCSRSGKDTKDTSLHKIILMHNSTILLAAI